MAAYHPDNWVVIKFNTSTPHYKILGGWSGSYLGGDSWKLNSGVVKMTTDQNYYNFYGASGSVYVCSKENYCLRNNNAYIWEQLKNKFGDKVKLMPEETDWGKIDWLIKA